MSDSPVSSGMSNKQERYDALVTVYSADLFRYAMWLCRNRSMAEDLVQETFLRAWKSLHSLRDDKAAKTWLFTILRRENARQYERFTPGFVDDYDFDGIAAEEDQNEQVTQLRESMKMLADEYREPLTLQVIGGYSSKEIAEILDINPGTVNTRVFRARKQLMELMAAGQSSNPLEGVK
ncbi:MAG: sigma-70 family RNA polymerase sigma factor [Gammaproteobacteria bacterium]